MALTFKDLTIARDVAGGLFDDCWWERSRLVALPRNKLKDLNSPLISRGGKTIPAGGWPTESRDASASPFCAVDMVGVEAESGGGEEEQEAWLCGDVDVRTRRCETRRRVEKRARVTQQPPPSSTTTD